MLDLTGSRADLGYVLAARTVPMVLFVLGGGIWADRLPRHHVMVVSNVLSALTQGAIAALLFSGHAQGHLRPSRDLPLRSSKSVCHGKK